MAKRTARSYIKGDKPVRPKYGNRKVTLYGMTFDSKKEADRYLVLRSEQLAGRISNLRCQVPFVVIPPIDKERGTKYIADFVYEKNGQMVVEDAKGFRTDVFKIKKKLMRWRYGIEVKEV